MKRTIGGKRYTLWDKFRTRAGAQTEAKRLRQKGSAARVVLLSEMSRHPFGVYVRQYVRKKGK